MCADGPKPRPCALYPWSQIGELSALKLNGSARGISGCCKGRVKSGEANSSESTSPKRAEGPGNRDHVGDGSILQPPEQVVEQRKLIGVAPRANMGKWGEAHAHEETFGGSFLTRWFRRVECVR